MKKILILTTAIIAVVAITLLARERYNKVEDNITLPDFAEISSTSKNLECSEVAGAEVLAANNPDKVGVSTTNFNQNRTFIISISQDKFTFEGMLSTGNEWELEWQVLENSDELLSAYLYAPETRNPRRELFTLFVDKASGQGVLQGSKFFQYVNTNATGFSIYVTCKSI